MGLGIDHLSLGDPFLVNFLTLRPIRNLQSGQQLAHRN
jgi:hypothetical protein